MCTCSLLFKNQTYLASDSVALIHTWKLPSATTVVCLICGLCTGTLFRDFSVMGQDAGGSSTSCSAWGVFLLLLRVALNFSDLSLRISARFCCVDAAQSHIRTLHPEGGREGGREGREACVNMSGSLKWFRVQF